jgi:CRISPR-associated exonuclease Cas4
VYISHVKCRGFRSLNDIELNLTKYNTLIGKNDAGKSTFLRAVKAVFDPEIKFTEDDLCKIPGCEQADCTVEAVLADCDHALAKNRQLTVRKTLADGLQVLGNVPKHPLLKKFLEGSVMRSDVNQGIALPEPLASRLSREIETLSPAGRIKGDVARQIYERIKDDEKIEFEDGWCPIAADTLSSMVKVVMLDAGVRGEEEVHDSGKSTLRQVGGILLREATKGDADFTSAQDSLFEQIDRLSQKDDRNKWALEAFNEFEETLLTEIKRFDGVAEARTQIKPPRTPFPMDFTVELTIVDGIVDGIDKMGHGLRRSAVFAMLRTYRQIRLKKSVRETEQAVATGGERKVDSTLYLFLIEEPELYLHPQAERRRMRELKELSEDENSQVLLCTHSSLFIDLAEYKGIHRFERPDRKVTLVKSGDGPEFSTEARDFVKSANRFNGYKSAMLFADLVILVEGATEEIVIPHLAEKLGLIQQNKEVEVVDCGGNSEIKFYQAYLEHFQIRYVAWYDSDSKKEIRAAINKARGAYGKLIATEVNWEKMNRLPAGNKLPNSWKKFIVDGELPNEKLTKRITAAYNWEDCEN